MYIGDCARCRPQPTTSPRLILFSVCMYVWLLWLVKCFWHHVEPHLYLARAFLDMQKPHTAMSDPFDWRTACVESKNQVEETRNNRRARANNTARRVRCGVSYIIKNYIQRARAHLHGGRLHKMWYIIACVRAVFADATIEPRLASLYSLYIYNMSNKLNNFFCWRRIR